MSNSNINDKYKFFKTAIVLFILILIVCVADFLLYASINILSNISKNITETVFILVSFIVLFAFGWLVWFFYKAELFDDATAYINKSIDSILKVTGASSNTSSSSSEQVPKLKTTQMHTKESPYWLFLRYLVFFLGLASTGAFIGFFISALGFVSPDYSIISVFILSILATILVLFSIFFLFQGILFDLTWSNINKNRYNISLIFYVLFVGLLLYYDPWNTMRKNVGIIVAVTILFLAFIFPLIYSSYYEAQGFTKSNVVKVIENSMGILFGLGISGLVIYIIYFFLTTGISYLTTDFGVFSYVINITLIITSLALLYKFLNRNEYIRKMPPIVRLIVNSFLYIPCLLTIFIDLAIAAFSPGKDRTYIILCLVLIVVLGFLMLKPYIEKKYMLQGGKLVLDKPPILLNKETKLSGYHDLNDPPKKKESKFSMSNTWEKLTDQLNPVTQMGRDFEKGIETDYYKDKKLQEDQSSLWNSIGKILHLNTNPTQNPSFDLSCPTTTTPAKKPTTTPSSSLDHFTYRYALSSWIFLDANPPNTNTNYNKFVSLLSYGNKPNIMYRAVTNTLRIVMEYKNLKEATEIEREDIQVDENGYRLIMEYDNVELQKWNNIIINNVGGTLDIFMNGELVGTANNVIPYMNYDSLTCGTKDGVNGMICNVVYYKHPLNKDQINVIYTSSKDKNPPTFPSFF